MKYLLLFFVLSSFQLLAQQEPDLDFRINIENPKYTGVETALIGIDASHNNLHTLKTNFAPFAKLMSADGYCPVSIEKITEETLDSLNVFVIANALDSSNVRNWRRPIANAFTKSEI